MLGQPRASWSSQRDHLLLAMLYNTGARVSEIIGVRVIDVVLDSAACVHLHGKGRKQRSVPLWNTTVLEVRAWLRVNPTLHGEAALLPQPRWAGDVQIQRRAAPGPRRERPPLSSPASSRSKSPLTRSTHHGRCICCSRACRST